MLILRLLACMLTLAIEPAVPDQCPPVCHHALTWDGRFGASQDLTRAFAAIVANPTRVEARAEAARAYKERGFPEIASLVQNGLAALRGTSVPTTLAHAEKRWQCWSSPLPGTRIGEQADRVTGRIIAGEYDEALKDATETARGDPSSCDNALSWARAAIWVVRMRPKVGITPDRERAVRLITTAAAAGIAAPGLIHVWATLNEVSSTFAALGDPATALAALVVAIERFKEEEPGPDDTHTLERLQQRREQLRKRINDLKSVSQGRNVKA